MDNRYRLFRRSWGTYYAFDNLTGQQFTLKTKDPDVAQELLQTRNEANREPLLNRQKGIAYLECADPQVKQRTWQHVMDDLVHMKRDTNRERWERAIRQEVLDSIRDQLVYGTLPEHFLKVLKSGTVSTNVYLRRILENRWCGRLARPGRRPAGRHRPVACTTSKLFFKHALNSCLLLWAGFLLSPIRRPRASSHQHAVPSGNCALAKRRSRQAMAERERCHFAAATAPPGRCSLRSVRNNRE